MSNRAKAWLWGVGAWCCLAGALLLPAVGSYFAHAGDTWFSRFCDYDSPTFMLSSMLGVVVVVTCMAGATICLTHAIDAAVKEDK